MPESGWLVLSLLGPEAEFSRGVAQLAEFLSERDAAKLNP
jgi:hypothetical protein